MSAALEWALVDGQCRKAAEFIGVSPEQRPAAVCPECSEPVVWKAGEKVVPHVAHRPDAICATTKPETAAHMNAKARLVELLTKATELPYYGKCSAPWMNHTSGASVEFDGPVHVHMEYRIGTRRPDVVVTDHDGEVIIAIEVMHSHAVDKAKAEDLAKSQTAWIEVTADDALRWDGIRRLRTMQCDVVTQGFLDEYCPKCTAAKEAKAKEAAEREARVKAAHEAKLRRFNEVVAEAAREAALRESWSKPRILRDRKELKRALANPPSLSIAVGIAMAGNPGPSWSAFVVMAEGKRPHVRFNAEPQSQVWPVWLGVEFALDTLIEKLPGRAATIYMHDGAVTSGANIDRVFGLGEPVKERIIAKLAATGSIVRTDTAHPESGAVTWCAYASGAAAKEKERAGLLARSTPPIFAPPRQSGAPLRVAQ